MYYNSGRCAFSYPAHEPYAFVVIQEDPYQHRWNHIPTGTGDIARTLTFGIYFALPSKLGRRRYWSGTFRDFHPLFFHGDTVRYRKRYVWMARERDISCHTDLTAVDFLLLQLSQQGSYSLGNITTLATYGISTTQHSAAGSALKSALAPFSSILLQM
jgi:hypothetical protein